MIEGVSIINCSNGNCKYLLKVYTKERISSMFGRIFHLKWNNMILLRKRQMKIEGNEIRILLRKGDNVQKYIDYVSKLIYHVDNLISVKGKKKQLKLKKIYPANYHILQNKSITQKVVNKSTIS